MFTSCLKPDHILLWTLIVVEMFLKPFQVLLNFPRSLFQDEGVTNKAFPTLDHIEHSLLLNNLNLNQVFLFKKERKKIAFGSSLILCETKFHEFIFKSDKMKIFQANTTGKRINRV